MLFSFAHSTYLSISTTLPNIFVTIIPLILLILLSTSSRSIPPSLSMSIISTFDKFDCADGGNVKDCVKVFK